MINLEVDNLPLLHAMELAKQDLVNTDPSLAEFLVSGLKDGA